MNYKGMAAGKAFGYLFSNMERQGHTRRRQTVSFYV